MARILDGRATALRIKERLAAEVTAFKLQSALSPCLAIFLIGDDPASELYVHHKQMDCKEVGMQSHLIKLSSQVSEQSLLSRIREANEDDSVDGIIVQLPLPPHISKVKIIDTISPSKDVDGFHHLNFGRLGTGLPAHIPATPNGILELLRWYHIETRGLHVVVVGRSYLVGLPTSILLARGKNPGDATVTLTHRYTKDLALHTRMADLLISAVGRPRFISSEMVKEGAIVVDVGITRTPDSTHSKGYKLVGDVDFESVEKKASYITPVPHGVGPMTRVALLMNTLRAARKEV